MCRVGILIFIRLLIDTLIRIYLGFVWCFWSTVCALTETYYHSYQTDC